MAAIPPPAANAADPHELARSLQFELMRVGCFVGKVTGEFDDDTKAALRKFLKRASKDLPEEPSPDAIKAVRGSDNRVCPLVCPRGEHAEDNACVANEPPPKRVERRQEREREPTSAPAAAPPKSPCSYVPDRGASYSGASGQRLGCN